MKASELKIKESDIQRTIKEYLKLIGFKVIKIQQGALSEPGIPDLWCIGITKNRDTVQFWIEVKTKTGKLSVYQEDFKTQVEILGGDVLVARRLEDVIEYLKVI